MELPIYAICFWTGLVFAIVSAVAGHLFGGHDGGGDVDGGGDLGTGGHAEAGFDNVGMPGLSIFSPTTIACFVTAFGAFGSIFSKVDATSNPAVTASLAVMGGLLVSGGVFLVFNSMFAKTQSSSESRIATLVGMEATVVTPIPRDGVGEISYVQGGSRYSAPAREEIGAAVPAGRTVKITRIVGTQFFVTPSQ